MGKKEFKEAKKATAGAEGSAPWSGLREEE
jgi:hypothetical protein